MPKYIHDVSDYFKNLSAQHPEVLHQDIPGSRAYEVREIEQAFGDLRSSTNGYLVRFILPTIRFEGDGNNARKVYQGGLLFARQVKRRDGDRDAEIVAMGEAEAVADSFLARMVADSRNGHPLFSSYVDTIDDLKPTGDFVAHEADGSYVAVVYLFDFSVFRCLDTSDVAWLDGGLTAL